MRSSCQNQPTWVSSGAAARIESRKPPRVIAAIDSSMRRTSVTYASTAAWYCVAASPFEASCEYANGTAR
jgi:hypothetical protein